MWMCYITLLTIQEVAVAVAVAVNQIFCFLVRRECPLRIRGNMRVGERKKGGGVGSVGLHTVRIRMY